jgi:predicted RNase H-like HicB family nuclease
MGFQMDSKQYTCRVTWSAEDNEYVGLCAEFPSLSWLDADQSKAFSGIEELVADVVADMISNNEKFLHHSPENIVGSLLSLFSVVQQKLALEAAERGVDINCLVSVKRAM